MSRGEWQPWRSNRQGQLSCEVASARLALRRPDPSDPPVEVEVALIGDWRKLLVVEGATAGAAIQDWQADLTSQQRRFWQEGWQAWPAPPAPTSPKLIPVMTTGQGLGALELARTSFHRWHCQENRMRDWLLPLHLDPNHGYAKKQVVNSELAKRQGVNSVWNTWRSSVERVWQTCEIRITNAKRKLIPMNNTGWSFRARSSHSK